MYGRHPYRVDPEWQVEEGQLRRRTSRLGAIDVDGRQYRKGYVVWGGGGDEFKTWHRTWDGAVRRSGQLTDWGIPGAGIFDADTGDRMRAPHPGDPEFGSPNPEFGAFVIDDAIAAIIIAAVAAVTAIVEAAKKAKDKKEAEKDAAINQLLADTRIVQAATLQAAAEKLGMDLQEAQARMEDLGLIEATSALGFDLKSLGDAAADTASTMTDDGSSSYTDAASDIWDTVESADTSEVQDTVLSLLTSAGEIVNTAAEDMDVFTSSATAPSTQDIWYMQNAVNQAQSMVDQAHAALDAYSESRGGGATRITLPSSMSRKSSAAAGGGALLLGLLALGGLGYLLTRKGK